MWKLIREEAKKRPLFAGIIVLACILVLGAAVDGIFARRAVTRYFDQAWQWAKTYDRDKAETKKKHDAEIRALTADRDAYRRKWEDAKGKMGKPWSPPSNAKALQERFNRMGYRGVLK